MSRIVRALFLFAVLLGAAAPRAQAQTVTTCNDTWAEIAAAVNAAAGTPGTHQVRIVQGSYSMTAPLAVEMTGNTSVQLLGGYTAGCGARTVNPANTTISGQSQHFIALRGQAGGIIEGLTLRNLDGLPEQRDGGLDLACSGTSTLTLTHNVFSQSVGRSAGVHVYNHAGCTVVLRNNLVAQMTAPASPGQWYGAWLLAGPSSGVPYQTVEQNTVVQIQPGAGNAALAVGRDARVQANLFRGNGSRDLHLIAGNAVDVVDNLFDLNPSQPIGGQDAGNFSADPLFVNAAGGNFRLQLTSPAINRGATFSDATRDLDGNGRLVGSRTDLGAWETNLNDLTQVVVSNTADSGAGSLRQAIIDANANADATLIRFAVPGTCGSQGILLLSPLPDVTTPVTIDGYTQAGSAANTINPGFNAQVCVGLTQVGALSHALRTEAGSRLTVRGLWFGNFDAAGAVPVRFDGGSGHVLEGSQFAGTLPNGSALSPNRVPVRIGAVGGARIGGPATGQRNWISGALAQGIAVVNAGIASGIVIQNNLIGTNSGGDGALANGGSGITISNSGGIEILGNLIGGNAASGISISSGAFGVVARGNRIGGWLAPSGGFIAQLIPNGAHGVQVLSGSLSVTVGGSEGADAGANDIVGNGGAGVMVSDGDAVRVRVNRITGNTGLGIDLGTTGVTPNDPGDGDTGANDLQNHPVIGAAHLAGDVLGVVGWLDSAVGNYAIDVHASGSCDASGHGEGQRWLGRFDLSIAAAGITSFARTITVASGSVALGQSVTVTATRTGPTNIGDTSEYSACVNVVAAINTIFANGFEAP